MKSLDCLTPESITLLNKNKVLRPLIREELITDVLSKVTIEEEIKEQKVKTFLQRTGLDDESKRDQFLKANNISLKDIENNALKPLRLKLFCKNNFSNKIESRFLKRKSELDIVVYSLIRVDDVNVAKELYLRICAKEAEFGELAAMYSWGPERKTRGIVGPITIGKGHPQLIKVLENSKIGEISRPILINDSYLIVRLECLEPAELDDFMREKMSEELFNNWIEEQVNDISTSILKEATLSTNIARK